jgi:hypothetical protein
MGRTNFYVNTALLCYLCRRVAVLRLTESWRDVTPAGQETEVLDVVFVSCARCSSLPDIHHAGVMTRPKFFVPSSPRYVDPKGYFQITRALSYIFGCTANILQEKKFHITAFKIINVAKIQDANELLPIPVVPEANIMILENGQEVRTNCGFFWHDGVFKDRQICRYPWNASKDDYIGSMPFASIANRPPILAQRPHETTQLCHRCMSDIIGPPQYTPRAE